MIAGAQKHAVLIVEDNHLVAKTIMHGLSAWGLENQHACSLEEAVQAVLTRGPFDIVISDHDLPDGTGMVLKDWLRDQVITVPFLLISGRLDFTHPETARFAFLRKPFTFHQLRGVMERLLPSIAPGEGKREAALEI